MSPRVDGGAEQELGAKVPLSAASGHMTSHPAHVSAALLLAYQSAFVESWPATEVELVRGDAPTGCPGLSTVFTGRR
jgi:hypothetical protein